MTKNFDAYAQSYDSWYQTALGRLADRLEKEACLSLLPDLGGQRVLEVGCGTGNFSLFMAGHGAGVVGLDRSRLMLAQAKSKAEDQGMSLNWIQGDLTRLPVAPESFDGVVSILALDFVGSRHAAIREMVQALRPGGRLAVAMLNRRSWWTLQRQVKAWFKPTLWRQVDFLTAAELARLLQDHPDLQDIRSRQAVYFPPWPWPPLVRGYPRLERWGSRLWPGYGAFMIATAIKKSPSARIALRQA